MSICRGHSLLVAALLIHGADPNQTCHFGTAPLNILQKNSVVCAQLLLGFGAKVDGNGFYYSPLHTAVCGGSGDLIALLLKHGADRLKRSEMNYTPLHRAAHQGNVEAIPHLLLTLEDADLQSSEALTPLQIAMQKDHTEFVEAYNRRLEEVQEPTKKKAKKQ